MRKYLAEMIGTMVLVLMGCGGAAIACSTAAGTITWVGVSLCFGLAVLTMCYAIGGVSGCHINPAITFAMWIAKKINGKDAICYVIFQIIGAFIGIAIVAAIVGHADGLAVNSVNPYDLKNALDMPLYSMPQAFITEVVMTFIFLLVIFGATSSKAPAGFGGVAIGLSLVLIHLVSIPVTNTSVNPARSLAPAVFDALGHGTGDGMHDLWIFIVAPLVGAALAALFWKYIEKAK